MISGNVDILSAASEERTDAFQNLMLQVLQISEQAGAPEPATFPERDALGEKVVSSTSHDYIAQLGVFITHYIQHACYTSFICLVKYHVIICLHMEL